MHFLWNEAGMLCDMMVSQYTICHLVSIFLSLINELQKQTQGKSKDRTEFNCIGPQSLCWSPRIKITSAYAYLLNCIKGI